MYVDRCPRIDHRSIVILAIAVVVILLTALYVRRHFSTTTAEPKLILSTPHERS